MDLRAYAQAAAGGAWVPLCPACAEPIDRLEVEDDAGYPRRVRGVLGRALRCPHCRELVHLGDDTLWIHAGRVPA